MIRIVNKPMVKTSPSSIQIVFPNGRRSFSKDVYFSAEIKDVELIVQKIIKDCFDTYEVESQVQSELSNKTQ